MHAGAIGIEQPRNPNLRTILPAIIETERFGSALAFIVTSPGAGTIHRADIVLRLRMDLRIAINLAGRRLKEPRLNAMTVFQGVKNAQNAGLHRPDGVALILRRGSVACEIIDAVDLKASQVVTHVRFDEMKTRMIQYRIQIFDYAGAKIVQAPYLVSIVNESPT
jgi:hypothetical protein